MKKIIYLFSLILFFSCGGKGVEGNVDQIISISAEENLEESARRIADSPEPISQEKEIKRLNEAIDKLNTLAESKDSESKPD